MVSEWREDADFGQKLGTLCCEHYRHQLKRKGKPQAGKEWTLMAAIVISIDNQGLGNPGYKLKVVSMGTGSKCLGQVKLTDKGDTVHDSHAEVVARRGFLRYIYEELGQVASGSQSELLTVVPESATRWQCELKPGVAVHLYSSHTPCGDASIFPKHVSVNPEDYGVEVLTKDVAARIRDPDDEVGCSLNNKRGCVRNSMDQTEGGHVQCGQERQTKRRKTELGQTTDVVRENQEDQCCEESPHHTTNPDSVHCRDETGKAGPTPGCYAIDVYRTGAKCVPGDSQDLQLAGPQYHVTGVLRTKPGRGDRTLSLSCSDKMARWNVLGIQGALITHFISRPIYLDSVVLGNQTAMERALYSRITELGKMPDGYGLHRPKLYHTNTEFDDNRSKLESSGGKVVPAPAAVIWWQGRSEVIHEASVHGLRLGVTTKNKGRPDARVSICKHEILRTFTSLLGLVPNNGVPEFVRTDLKTYEQYKQAAKNHQEAFAQLRNIFSSWPRTPRSLNNFTLTCT